MNVGTLGAPCAASAPPDSPAKPGGVGCGKPAAIDPISVATGNVFETVQDYATAGQNPLAFTRYYNSMSVPDTYAVALGSNWRHIYDRYLHIINPSAIYGVLAERPTGQSVGFSSNSGIYTSDTDLDYNLTRSGSTWTLTDPDDSIETYTASGAVATLQTIKRRGGYTLTMHYTSGRLTSVTDSYGRTLGMTYTGNLLTGLTTPDTLALTYGYVNFSSGGHLLSTVSYNTSPVTKQTYLYENASYPAALTGITDENNKRFATWTYDGNGRGAASQLAGAVNFTSVSYYDNGDRKVTGPLGITETYKFLPLQGVPKVTEIDRAANGTVAAAVEKFAYDANGYTKSVTDWNGNNTWFVNNAHGLPTAITYASASTVAHTTTIAYDPTWARLAKTITTPGLTVTNNYEAATGNLLTRVLTDTTTTSVPYSTNGQTRTWTYTYTPTGQLKTAQLPRTDVVAKTTFGYGAASPNLGTLVSVTDALSHVMTINTYKPGGLPLTVTDPNGVLTTLGYSPRLWLTSAGLTTASGVLTASLQYDSAGNLTRATQPDGSYLATGYDDAHRPIKITNILNETQNITYNSAGNLTQAVWKNGAAINKFVHSGTFDALGRMRTDVGGQGQTTTFTYDNNGNATSIKDPLLHVASQSFDALNRLKSYTDAATDLSQYSYDAHDRPLTVTDPRGKVTSYVYDGFGEVIQETSPDRGATVWRYDADGNVSSKTDAASAVTNYTYDALDRLLTRAYPADSTLNAALTYDQTGHGKGIGRLTSATDQAGSLSLSYEERGLVTSNARTIASTAYTTGYTYESAGRLATVTYPGGGWLVTYLRDTAGQITAVRATQPGHTIVNLATTIKHFPFGPVTNITWANGVVGVRGYDFSYRMTALTDTGSAAVQNLAYGYDADDNVHTITDNVTTANTQTLNYDVLDRLSSATGGYGSTGAITYDSNSNRLGYGATAYTIATASNRLATAAGATVSHSATGNITGIGSAASMTYNKANQLATATVSSSTSTYGYDAFGQRLKVTTGTSPLQVTSYDQAGHVLAETNNGVETDYVWADSTPVAAIQPAAATISYIHTDRLGTPQKATSSTQANVWLGNYQPFGAVSPTATITQNLRLPGQNADATGFYHNGFRTYNPALGRYLEADPIGLAGGLNPYAYVLNNPGKWTDRLGLGIDTNDQNCNLPGGCHENPSGEIQPPQLDPIEQHSPFPQSTVVDPNGEVIRQLPAMVPLGNPNPSTPAGQCQPPTQQLLNAGMADDRGGLTKAGRALQKHTNREPTVFPSISGNPQSINQQGQQVLQGILTSGNQRTEANNYGGVDIYDNISGRGVRYDQNGNMVGFLQPRRDQ